MDTSKFDRYISEHDVFCIDYGGHEYTITDVVYPSDNYGRNCFDCLCLDKDGEIVNDDRTFKVDSIRKITASCAEDDDDTSETRLLYLLRFYDTLLIGYTNAEGDYHEMNITDINYPSAEYGEGYFDALCIDDNGEPEEVVRSFKISRLDFLSPSEYDGFEEDEEDD